ncbi:DUF4296 domain-containing protein [Abyssalbus ytuae]|uniref:DUF4296 domain-containing protein n=1 Tax=Abyssalbus ytuae TaxID=2926907 RepID=A0A9E7CY63_9FLAO|nr:DUF4296 domain-containing protein [Abyssalbus ytuae]UOB16300.1 DUF4296 domain-containing protein [Abyssalbus ytuae]
MTANKILAAFFMVFALSCNRSVVEKPDDIITEKQMVDVLYDIAIVRANMGTGKSKENYKGLSPEEYIYKKYQIDSTRLSNSIIYYTSKPEKNVEIYTKVEERLQAVKETLEKEKDSIQESLKTKKDSLKLIKKR